MSQLAPERNPPTDVPVTRGWLAALSDALHEARRAENTWLAGKLEEIHEHLATKGASGAAHVSSTPLDIASAEPTVLGYAHIDRMSGELLGASDRPMRASHIESVRIVKLSDYQKAVYGEVWNDDAKA